MGVTVGDTLLGGQVIVASVSGDLITSITIPLLGDGVEPFRLTFNPGQLPADVEKIAKAVLSVLG